MVGRKVGDAALQLIRWRCTYFYILCHLMPVVPPLRGSMLVCGKFHFTTLARASLEAQDQPSIRTMSRERRVNPCGTTDTEDCQSTPSQFLVLYS